MHRACDDVVVEHSGKDDSDENSEDEGESRVGSIKRKRKNLAAEIASKKTKKIKKRKESKESTKKKNGAKGTKFQKEETAGRDPPIFISLFRHDNTKTMCACRLVIHVCTHTRNTHARTHTKIICA